MENRISARAMDRIRPRRLTNVEAPEMIMAQNRAEAEAQAQVQDQEEDEPLELISDDEEDAEPEVLEIVDEDRNVVPQTGDGDVADEADEEPPPQRRRLDTREETRSERILSGAVLQPLQQTEEVMVVSTRREGVVAEWTTNPGRTQLRRDPTNILRDTEGLASNAARCISTELDAFLLFFSEDIMQEIVNQTNEKLQEQKNKYKESAEEEDFKKSEFLFAPLDRTELLAFLGLSVLRGTVPLESAAQLFHGAFSPPPFRATMSQRRYSKVLSCISFDDRASRADRRRGDKFCIMRDVFRKFDGNLRKHYKPSDCLTIDETLVPYRGRCPFKVYMPSKPGKYGMLVRSVADARSGYIWKLWPYSGRPEVPGESPPDVVMESVPQLVHFLVKDIKNSGRNVTMDR